jgi:hypothetical protein
MKNLLKDKKMLVGLVLLAGVAGYYFYNKNKKAKIMSVAQVAASKPAVLDASTATAVTLEETDKPIIHKANK